MVPYVASEDFETQIGRASDGKSFVRVIHLPTKTERSVVGWNGDSSSQIVERLVKEILDEIGQTHHHTGSATASRKR